jgi:Cys-tRNA(Pro)/Cys-tRNA(Cys) deacylase
MSKSTRATLALKKLGVNVTLHSYDYDADAERVGLQAAEAIGVRPQRILKTLMLRSTTSQSVSSSRRIVKSA